jgi:hypothetical protein
VALGVCVAVGATACATSSTPGGASTAVAASPIGGTGGASRGVGIEITARNEGASTSFAGADPAAVYAALEAAYVTLQIPLSRKEDATRTLGNDGLKMRRQLGKIELRRAFDCGGTSGMPDSETYTITAGITSSVTADPARGTVVTTMIDASAENPNYPGSGVRCSSAGTIEEAIAKEIRKTLSGRP